MATKWRRNGKVRADDMEIENRYTDTVQNQDQTGKAVSLEAVFLFGQIRQEGKA